MKVLDYIVGSIALVAFLLLIVENTPFGDEHAISAFCNAGVSTFSDSLVQFRSDLATNAIVAGLIVIEGP